MNEEIKISAADQLALELQKRGSLSIYRPAFPRSYASNFGHLQHGRSVDASSWHQSKQDDESACRSWH